MKSLATTSFIINILLSILAVILIVFTIILSASMEYSVLLMIFGILFFIIFVISNKLLKTTYRCSLIVNRKSNLWCQKLTLEEHELIEDAKELIKSVDPSIIISNFNVYKVIFSKQSWFHYDERTQELCVFIPFKRFLRFGKDLCFISIVHEALHSQNLKNNLMIFNLDFLEGLNQLLTIWLIENYSKKYTIPDRICIFSLKLKKNVYLNISSPYSIYRKNVNMVKNILQESEIDLKDLFINYIDIQPTFFKDFVPSEHFKKQ